MRLVIDANPLIAGFLRDSTSRKIIFSNEIILFSPDWLRDEFDRNETELMKRFPTPEKFSETKSALCRFVNIIPSTEYSSCLKEALSLVKHDKDAPYFALALYLGIPIWSEEKSFKLQSKVMIYSTSELIRLLSL